MMDDNPQIPRTNHWKIKIRCARLVKCQELTLPFAWKDICRRLALEEIPLPRLNVSPTGVSVSSCSAATRAFVLKAYAADYRIFGYQP
jgi:hypothetical protein